MKYSRPTQKKHTNGTLSQKGENSASTSTTQRAEKGENGSRKMSGSEIKKTKLPIGPNNPRLGVRLKTGLSNKGKSGDRIAFKPGTKPGMDQRWYLHG